jgi:hypothetical protein
LKIYFNNRNLKPIDFTILQNYTLMDMKLFSHSVFKIKNSIAFTACFLIFHNSASALTTRTWTGATNSNFNTSTNWSPNAVPSSTDSCVIILSGNKTISLSGNITIGALYLKETGNGKLLTLNLASYLLTINGNLHTLTGGNSNTSVDINLSSSTGGVTVGRHAFLDDGGVSYNHFYGDVTSPGVFTFNGNLTIGAYAYTTPGDEPDIVFNASTSQTIIPNNTYSYFLGEDVTIGTTNNPTVTVSGSTIDAVGCYDGGVTINGTSILDINNHYFDCFSSTGYFVMNSTSTLKIAGTNEFPFGYSTATLASGSNTYYDGTSQTVTNLTYGNLYLSTSGTKTFGASSVINGNLTTSGTVTADINAPLDMNGNVVIGNGTTVLGGSSITSTVAGNWTNSGTFTKETSTITFDGTATKTITSTLSSVVNPGSTLLTESFENGGAIPAGWSSAIVTDGGVDPICSYVSASTYPTGFVASSGSYFVKFNSYTASSTGQVRLKKTTSFSTVGLSNIIVNFDWTNDNVYINTDNVVVQYSTNGTSWTTAGSAIYRYTGAANSWTNQSVTLPVGAENQATVYIAFLFTSNYGNDCYLDNVSVFNNTTESYAGEAFNILKLNKTGGASVTLASKVLIGSSMNFTAGIMTSTSSFYPEFDEDATVTGTPSNTCHVNGTVLKRTNTTTKFTYPVGNGTAYRSIAITPSGTGATIWTAKYNGVGYSDTDVESSLSSILTQEYWDLNRSGSSPSNAVLEVTWIASTSVSDYTRLSIAHYDGTTDWDKITSGAVGSNTSGTLTSSSAVSTFSPFTIGYTPIVMLPISLMKFEGENKGVNKNELNWVTSAEHNNDYFTIEKSLNGTEFFEVGTKVGAGNSSTQINYFLVDSDYRNEINYYRLKQTDFDGKFTYSDIISIDNRVNAKSIVKTINLLGQEVNSNYKGAVIIVYSDNTVLRTVQGF